MNRFPLARIVLFLIVAALLSGCKPPAPSDNRQPDAPSTEDEQAENSKSQSSPKTVQGVLLEPTRALANLEILIPKDFEKMGDEMLRTKYPNANRPSLVYTNEPGTVNISVNHTQNAVPASQLKQLHQ